MSITGGISFIGFISPTEETDTYPVTNPKYGLGGLRTVKSISGDSPNLYEITDRRRELGMIAFVTDESSYYHLLGGTGNEHWQLLEFDGKDGVTGATGPPVKFTFGITVPSVSESRFGDYFLGASGSSAQYEGKLFIFARLDEDEGTTGTWWEISGVAGDDGSDGINGATGPTGPPGSGKYFYGPTAPESTDDGLTLGSKWFNTTVGAEFTYIVEEDDTSQWVMVNVFSATGPQGAVGIGSQGFQGIPGPSGTDGFLGGTGSQGFQGFQGNIGITGTQGFQGFQGNIGVTGVQGFQGFQGNIGITGTQGFQGFQGNVGVTGVQGFQGFQGLIGITGVQGFQGFQGNIGITGVQGFQGFQGAKGSGKYFYGPTAPESTDDGLTLGSKWFNTEVGAEFTYIVEGDDTTQWVMVNVFSATGPQGPLGGGTGNQGFQGFQGNIGITGTGYTSAEIRDNYLYVTKVFSDGTTSEFNLGYIGPTGSGFVFDADITAAFGPNKTFGKYEDGDLIPALGKTAVQVIKEALFDVVNPTVSASSSTVIDFYQEEISNQITLSYTINTLGATVSETILQHRRGNGSWSNLDSTLRSSGYTYTHTATKPKEDQNTWNYRWIVRDSLGGETISNEVVITPQSYQNPTISWGQYKINNSTVVGETVTKRESGNNETKLASNTNSNNNIIITSREVYSGIVSWALQYSTNGGATWSTIQSAAFGETGSVSIPPITHIPFEEDLTNIRYRMYVEDDYTITDALVLPNYYYLPTITFLKGIFFGPTGSYPTTSTNLRNLPQRYLSDFSNPFNLETGDQFNVFVIALPTPQTVTNVTDESNLGASLFNINSSNEASYYVLNSGLTTINNYNSSPQTYNVYVYNPAIAYTSNAIHEVTRSLS